MKQKRLLTNEPQPDGCFAVILFVGTCVSYVSKRFRITAVPMFMVIGIIMSGLGVESQEGLSFVVDRGLNWNQII